MLETRLLNWEENADQICREIAGRESPIKVVLKTKDERFLLKRWIQHYIDLFGSDGIVIFDNGSTNESVIETYEAYSDRILIYTYKGSVDTIHITTNFKRLYDALRQSSEYFAFLDTDEFLVGMNEDKLLSADATRSQILHSGKAAYFGVWLQNLAKSDRRFWLTEDRLVQGMLWGKPIIRRDAVLPEFVNHNHQLVSLMDDTTPLVADLFLLHLNLLFPRQRIEANLRKLVTFGAISPGTRPEDLLHEDAQRFPKGNVRNWIQEIKNLLATENEVVPTSLPPDAIEFLQDGKLEFTKETQKPLLSSFLRDARSYLKR